jgi:FMNH2-dependent dimethyl sulfone monooxygenase
MPALTTARTPGTSGLRDSQNALKLGVFSFNCSGGLNISALPRAYHVSWEHTSAIARVADEMGLEFLLPVAKWRGFDGATDFYGESYETLTWAAGIAAQTSQITVAATVHVPLVHPTFVAKAGATIDHISGGRFALNVVMGWSPKEFDQFGANPIAHDRRYEQGDDWVRVLDRLWSDTEPFEHATEWFELRSALSKPKPLRRPLLMNAGTSPAGVDFTARHCDYSLASRNEIDGSAPFVADIKETARTRHGRKLGVLNVAHVICADTEKEAWRRHAAILEHADSEGLENFLGPLSTGSQSYQETLERFRTYFVTSGGGIPLVGTPEQVADGMIALSAAGFDGLALGFFDYLDDLGAFGESVMPLLREAGVRQ